MRLTGVGHVLGLDVYVEVLEELVAIFGARVRIAVPALLFEEERRLGKEKLRQSFDAGRQAFVHVVNFECVLTALALAHVRLVFNDFHTAAGANAFKATFFLIFFIFFI